MQRRATPSLELEYGTFDLAGAICMLAPSSPTSPLPWLLELHALLKPGGYLIATFIGSFHSEFFADEPWDPDRSA